MKIRKVNKKDKKSVSDLYRKIHPMGKRIPHLLEKLAIKQYVFVAEEKRQMVGFVWGYIVTHGFFKYAVIEELNVEKKFRRQGLGKSLLGAFIKEMKTLKILTILVTVSKKNTIAVSLYKRLGFQTSPDYWFYLIPK